MEKPTGQFSNIDEYIDMFSEDVQEILKKYILQHVKIILGFIQHHQPLKHLKKNLSNIKHLKERFNFQ